MCLIVIDALSEWPERGGLQSASTGITEEQLRTIVANKGISEILVSDDSPQFAADSCVEMLYHPARVKMLCRPATNEQADSFVKLLKRAVRKGEFASAQTVFLLLCENAIHPANADRLYGRALRSRLDLLRPDGSVVGAVLHPTLVCDFDVGQPVMEPANCLVQIDGGGVWARHVEQRHVRCSASPPSCRACWHPRV